MFFMQERTWDLKVSVDVMKDDEANRYLKEEDWEETFDGNP